MNAEVFIEFNILNMVCKNKKWWTELLLPTQKGLHWRLCKVVEVCSQGWTIEHDQGPSKSPIADCLELIRSPGFFGRLAAIGSIFLLRTTKVSSNSERESFKWSFLFVSTTLLLGFLMQEPKLEAVFRISVFILVGVVTMDRTSLIFDTHKFLVLSLLRPSSD